MLQLYTHWRKLYKYLFVLEKRLVYFIVNIVSLNLYLEEYRKKNITYKQLINFRHFYTKVLRKKLNYFYYTLKYYTAVYFEQKNTVTSRLFTHIVSTKKMRKDMRDRKDMRGTNYTYCISCFLILLLIKSRLGTFPLLTTCLLYL